MAPRRRLPIMTRDVTSIEIKKATWRELNQLKHDPGDSFDDVIQRLLARPEAEEPPEPEEPVEKTDDTENAIYDCPDCDWTGDDWEAFQDHLETHDI